MNFDFTLGNVGRNMRLYSENANYRLDFGEQIVADQHKLQVYCILYIGIHF